MPQNKTKAESFKGDDSTSAVIVDANYTLEESMEGTTVPASIKKNLELITVQYYGFDGLLHQGQLLVNNSVADDLINIFNFIKQTKFPVEKVIPIVKYNWSDDKSMEENNTSVFNYRFISGSKILSMHAQGEAIDINPRQNPYIKNGDCSPKGSVYDVTKKGTILPNSELVKEFKEKGWEWGGDWKSLKDYQHFQKGTK